MDPTSIGRLPHGKGVRRRAVAAAALSGAISLALFLPALAPARRLDRVSYSTAVYDRNGALLRLTLSQDEKFRLRAAGGDIPPRFIEALLLKEDRLFYCHAGVNPCSLAKAFWHSIVRRDFRAGGSTITMQLARLLYGLDTGTPVGKARQILIAVALELSCPKDAILRGYCSLVPCGRNVEGFPAASLLYLRKSLSSLSLSETLMLCCVPQLPGARTPDGSSAALREAGALLYSAWVLRHPEDAKLPARFDMPLDLSLYAPFEAPHAVVSLLIENPGKTRIDSTIDSGLQRMLERVVRGYVGRRAAEGVRNASALLVRIKGMEVLAEAGSADFFDDSICGQVNGTEARRSPGSALKPFLYALALDQGLIHPMTVLKDAPIHFSGYNPDNFDDDFEGPIKAKDALIRSRNVPAVALARMVKDPDLYDFLVRGGVSGLRPRDDYGVSIALGTAEVTMKELAALYGVLANRGEFRPLSETIEPGAGGRGGRSAPRALLSPEAAFLVLKILQEKTRPDWINPVALRNAPGPCAWKTGTSIGFRDAWSVGIFDSFIVLVWVGNFDGSGNPAFVGLRSASPLMFEIMDAVRASGIERDYLTDEVHGAPPAGLDIIVTKVCSVSGKIPGPFCTSLTDTLFIPGKSPIDACDVHQEIYIDKKTGLRRALSKAGETRSMVYEIWPSDILALFEKAGMPRRQPPPFAADEDLEGRSATGRPPQIVSPLPKGEYAFRLTGGEPQEMPFIAVVPSDTATVFWFLDESYLGKSPGGKPFFWKPAPGSYVLRATDEHGRSGVCPFTVVARE